MHQNFYRYEKMNSIPGWGISRLQSSVIFLRRKLMLRPEFVTDSREMVKSWFLEIAKVPTLIFLEKTKYVCYNDFLCMFPYTAIYRIYISIENR